MSNPKSSNSGCFSAVFRRLLCSGSPQTHPSDHIAELKPVDDVAKIQVQASETCPGIVARLMGLDSLLENNWVSKGKNPVPVTRSRSVNFVDYILDFDSTQATHRRVKTSTSFREVLQRGPQLLQHNDHQNHEFLVVYMDKNKETERKLKSQRGDGSSKQKESVKKENKEKNKKISKLKNEPRRVSGKQSLKSNRCIGEANNFSSNSKPKTQLKKKKKKNQCEVEKVEYSENNSEGSSSSPVSVLNVNDFAPYQEHGISEDSKSLELMLEKNFESTYKEETVYYMELVDMPCKLTDKDVNFSNWITKKVFTFEDICVLFEEQILDIMLHQVANELVGFR